MSGHQSLHGSPQPVEFSFAHAAPLRISNAASRPALQ
jgi:hypothetical protein